VVMFRSLPSELEANISQITQVGFTRNGLPYNNFCRDWWTMYLVGSMLRVLKVV